MSRADAQADAEDRDQRPEPNPRDESPARSLESGAPGANTHDAAPDTGVCESSNRVTVIVPCYDEAKRLDVERFVAYLGAHPRVQLLFVDDGSKDETFAVLKRIRDARPDQVELFQLEQNSGKAEAVRRGIQRAIERGAHYVGYWDADLATPLEVIGDFESALDGDTNVDIVLGARVALLGRKIDRTPVRHYLGRVFATVASVALNLPVYDTQCGAKLFRVTPRTQAIFEQPFDSRWVFDVELLARYLRSGDGASGLYEYPVPRWVDVADSKVKPADFFRAIGEIAKIYRRYPLDQPLRPLIMPLTGLFSRYVIVGGLGTSLHYVVLVSLVELFAISKGSAAAAGAVAGAVANYFFNFHFTFTSRAKHTSAFAKFAFIAVLGALLSGYGVRSGVELGFHYVVAQVFCTLVFLVLGFLINKAWTFSSARSP